MTMFEYESSDNAMSKDALFLERLDTFMDKCLVDIKAFAERELRPYQEVFWDLSIGNFLRSDNFVLRRREGISHNGTLNISSSLRCHRCHLQLQLQFLPIIHLKVRQLFNFLFFVSSVVLVRDVLRDTSRILESLCEVAGVQSFILAVDPSDTSDNGFLGGSVVGRQFWRGLRGGGEGGARALKAYSINHLQRQSASRQSVHIPRASSPPPKGGVARSLKNQLYESVRNALRYALIFSHVHTFKVSFPFRSASGVRSAEMKWTNPERLDAYGVRLIGWPEGVPAQNPSSFKVKQNKVLLEALQNGSMRFEKITPAAPRQEEASEANEDDPHEDFSWAYDADASPPLSHAEYPTTIPPSPPRQLLNTGQTPVLPVIIDEAESNWTSTLETDSILSQYTVNYLWAEDLNEPTTEPAWDEESDVDLRSRKRPRSAGP